MQFATKRHREKSLEARQNYLKFPKPIYKIPEIVKTF